MSSSPVVNAINTVKAANPEITKEQITSALKHLGYSQNAISAALIESDHSAPQTQDQPRFTSSLRR